MIFDEYIAGVDYSLTSPAVCVAKVVNDDITFENCTFHFIKQTKSQKSFDKIYSYDYPEYTDDIERFTVTFQYQYWTTVDGTAA